MENYDLKFVCFIFALIEVLLYYMANVYQNMTRNKMGVRYLRDIVKYMAIDISIIYHGTGEK